MWCLIRLCWPVPGWTPPPERQTSSSRDHDAAVASGNSGCFHKPSVSTAAHLPGAGQKEVCRDPASGMRFDAPAWARAPAQIFLLLIIAFTLLYLVVGDDGAPGGPMFALLLIYATAYAGGKCAGLLHLPPLLGMLCIGLAWRNVPYVKEHVGARIDPRWSSAIRLLALTLILCRAGLSFDVAALRRLRFIVARLALLPCLTEAAVIMGLAVALLDFPVAWSALLGFVVAAISPAVVVPSLLSLQERGYGTATGIPTMVVAAAPLDDVFSIAGFGICLSLSIDGAGGGTPLWLDVARAPLELAVGAGTGLLGAALVLALESPALAAGAVQGPGVRGLALLLGLAATAAFGLRRARLSGASALSVLVLAAAAAHGWGVAETKPRAAQLADVWNHAAQPLLFGLVGSAVDVGSLEARVVGLGLAMLACGLAARCTVAYLAVGGQGLRWQERLFTAVAWMPKATVQAAIGAVALDEATNAREEEMGRDVLAIAVLSIICTAPVGAIAISILGPRLLLLDGCNAIEVRTSGGKGDDAVEASSAEEDVIAMKGSSGNAEGAPDSQS